MAVRATASLRPAATGWRSGFDSQQHWPADARTAVCGEQVREQRYDRPDLPRCIDCIETAGIVVPAPPDARLTALRAERDPDIWTESELRLVHGDR